MTHITPAVIDQFFQHYGSIGLFFLLALGIFGLPIPDETLLTIAGFLMAQSHLPITTTVIACYAGSACGITISYIMGLTIGKPLLFHFGQKIGLSRKRFEKAHTFCEQHGRWSLLFGYYLPGVRHLIGVVAGATYLSYRQFALFAYIGVLLWSATFLSIGYFFYHEWHTILFHLFRSTHI